MLSKWPSVIALKTQIIMKKILKAVFTLWTLFLTIENANAYLVNGAASIVWKGNPWTSTSGTVYCSSDMMQICCSISGSSIAINMGGQWWWGTIRFAYDPSTGSDPWYEFDENGLEEGPAPN